MQMEKKNQYWLEEAKVNIYKDEQFKTDFEK